MIKAKLIKLTQGRFGGSNVTADVRNKLHELDIEQYYVMGFNTLLGQIFKDHTQSYDRYCIPYLVDILTDGHTYYSLLPCNVAQLLDTQGGVRRIYPKNSFNTPFIPIERDSFARWQHVDTGMVTDTIGYAVLIDRVIYEKRPIQIEVKMDIVPTFDVYPDDFDIPIPAGADTQLFEIMLQMIQGTPSVDKRNDGLPNKDL